MQNCNCFQNNEFTGNNYPSLGGCFGTYNIKIRIFLNIQINNCFSNQTTFGIKIIDENKYNNYKILIINCIFNDNLIFYVEEFETGGAIFLSSDNDVLIKNCTFEVNKNKFIFYNLI